MGGRPTLEDVAREAGVSVKTASRVVNREPYVSERVRDAVAAAIAALGYRPNAAARALASGRSFAIGLLSPRLSSSYFRRLNGEVLGACRERGYHLVIEQLELAGGYLDQVARFIAEMRLDGLVLAPGVADSAEIHATLRRAGVRAVAISPRAGSDADLIVSADEQQGERDLADALWALGHRRFAIAEPPAFWRFTRGQAFARRLAELGADPQATAFVPFDWRIPALEGGRRMALAMLEAGPRPTALFAASDELAAGAIGLCLSRGVGVPADISIAGFDDDEIAQATWPALTTIRQPLDAMMAHAIDLLVGEERTTARAKIVCPVELVMRDSVGPRPEGLGA